MNLYGAIIKHERNMDVCYDVVKSLDVGHKMILKVQVINMAFVSSYYMNFAFNIEINKTNMASWSECEDKTAKCFRYAKWRKLR